MNAAFRYASIIVALIPLAEARAIDLGEQLLQPIDFDQADADPAAFAADGRGVAPG
jgi:hypothetical protein